jgi:hypothetical protein
LERLWRDIRLLQQEARITSHELGAVTNERRHSGAAAAPSTTSTTAAAVSALTITVDADTDDSAIAIDTTDHPEDLVAVTALRAEIAAAQVSPAPYIQLHTSRHDSIAY